MTTNYKKTFEQYIENYNSIRNELNLNKLKAARCFTFENKLGNNEEIAKAIRESLEGEDTRTFLIAPTGSGKTYTLLKEMNKIKAKEGEILVKLFFEPTRALTTQCETIYEQFNVKSIIGEDFIDMGDIKDNKTFAVVYDKFNIIESIRKNIEERNKKARFLIVIDETHDLIADQFRGECLRNITKTLEGLVDYNIIYTTATFYNCYTLDIDNIIFCNPSHEISIKEIDELVTPFGHKNNDFIVSHMIKELKAGNKIFSRVNNKDLIECIQFKLVNLGYKVFTLTSKDKGFKFVDNEIVYDNPLYEAILRGELPDFDVILVTCLLDEGISITSVNGEQPTNVIPCFIYNATNFLLDDYKQFVARFRWTLDRSILFVASHELTTISEDETTLREIVKNNFSTYNRFFNSFELSFKAAQMRYTNEKNEIDNDKVAQEIKFLLSQENYFGEKNDMGNTIYYNGKINFDLNKFFNYMYEEYQRQFITQDILRESKLRELFACDVKIYLELDEEEIYKLDDYNTVKYEEKIEQIKALQKERIEFVDYFENVNKENMDEETKALVNTMNSMNNDKDAIAKKEVEIKNKTNELIKSIGAINNDNSKLFATLYGYNNDDINELLSIYDNKEALRGKVVTYLIEDLKTLTMDELKELKSELMEEEHHTSNQKIKRILSSSISDYLKSATNEMNIDLKKFITYIIEVNANNKKVKYYLKEEQAIFNNILFEKGFKYTGKAMEEQYTLINYIENAKGKNSTYTITTKIMEDIKKEMIKVTGKNWGDLAIKNFIKLVYTFQENKKEKTITVRSLRKKHIQTN